MPPNATVPLTGAVILHGAVPPQGTILGAEEHPVVVSTAQTRLEEIKVELAWLADITTFCYELGARINEGSLEVRGFVPNEVMREKALQIARQHTSFSVVDKLQLMPSLSARSAGVPVDEVKEAATTLLNEKLSGEIKGLQVKAAITGQVTVNGSVPSLEEKLAVSRVLRQVHGCNGVVNHLQVTPVLRGGKQTTLITRDGKESIVGPLPELEAAQPEGKALMVPEGRAIMVPEGKALMASPPPTGSVPPMKSAPEKRITPYTTDAPSKPIKPMPAAPKEGEELPAPKALPSLKSAGPEIAPPSAKGKKDSEELPTPKALPPAKPASPELAPPSAKGKKDGVPDVLATPGLPPSWAKPKDEGKAENKAKGSELAPVSHETVPKADKAYETTGTVIFEDDVKPTVPKNQGPPPMPAARLKQHVESVCGRQARDVQVSTLPNQHLHLKVTVADAVTAKALTDKILAMPEMASPQIELEIATEPR
jgi:hypothetical protein